MNPARELSDLKEKNAKLEILVQEMQREQKYQTIVGLPGYGTGGISVDASQLVPEGGSGGGGGDDSPTVEVDIAIGGDLIPYLIHGEPA
jgi:hypothetical protein